MLDYATNQLHELYADQHDLADRKGSLLRFAQAATGGSIGVLAVGLFG